MKQVRLGWIGLGLISLGAVASVLGMAQSESVQSRIGPIHVISVEASINPITKDYIVEEIREARQLGASLVILELDTPGGLVSSTQDIVEEILNSPIPIVVWVGPAGSWAASAGTFITMSAHVATMALGSTIGAAHPVNIDGSNPGGGNEPSNTPSLPGTTESESDSGDGETSNPTDTSSSSEAADPIEQKITNFTATWAREIANKRGRNADWAEQSVRNSVTAGAEEAVEKNIIDFIANSRAELIEMLNNLPVEVTNEGGRSEQIVIVTEGVAIVERPMSFQENLLNYLADPNLVYILLSLGLLAFTYEFLSPTIGIGFVVGGIFLFLAFMGLQVLPVNYVGLGLIMFGILLMVLDVFTATNGILTTGGVVALLIGSFTLFELPEVQAQFSPITIIAITAMITVFFAFVVTKGLVIQKRRPVTGLEGMIGLPGRVDEVLNPSGRVFVNGEYWFAKTIDAAAISIDEEIVVEQVQDGKLIVRKRY